MTKIKKKSFKINYALWQVYIFPCPAPAPSRITARSTAEIWSTFLVPGEEKSAISEKPLLRESYPLSQQNLEPWKIGHSWNVPTLGVKTC